MLFVTGMTLMKKTNFLTLLLLVLLPCMALAQGITGTIIDQDGNPLPYTTLYVYETGSGSISNEVGIYTLNLDPGSYRITFQFLGHETQQITAEIGSEMIRQDIIMPQQAYLLNEAEVSGGKEDPSYPIMRKAIAKSSYHRQQVDKYTCEVYLKGGGRLTSIPWFLEDVMEEEGIDTSATFVTESVSEISYTRPGNYEEKVISIRSSGDSRNTNPMQYVNSSFYDPKIGNLVSPLSPKAFAYYKFRYIRTYEDRGFQINEIKVIPRSVGEDVAAGRLFIVEGLWCIHSLNLESNVQGILVGIDQVYAPVAETAWLPVSHVFNGSGKIFGVGFEFQYLATVSKYDVVLNSDLDATFVVLDEKTEKEEIENREPSKSQKIISDTEAKLENGEELTRKELRKLLVQYEKASRKQEEEPQVMETRSLEIDSTAYKSDSSYWAMKRPIPLSEREVKGYDLQDSLEIAQKKEQEGDTLDTGKGNFSALDLILGNRYNLGNDNYFNIDPVYTGIQFNTVDGWNAEYRVSYIKRFEQGKRLEISPRIRYAFKREKVSWDTFSEYKYGTGLKKGSVSFEAGQYYSQFNANNPILPVLNTFTSLMNERNFMKVYDKDYGAVNWQHKLLHNLTLNTGSSYTERTETFNTTSQTWKPIDDRSYSSNQPDNIELENTSFGKSTAFKAKIGLSYRPGARYNKTGDRYSRANSPPTFTVEYETAIPGIADAHIDYDLVSLGMKYRLDFNLLGKLGFDTKVGKFISTKNMDFTDFAHFQGNQTVLTRAEQLAGFANLPYYEYSTSDAFARTYVNYEFRQFLFTSIPMIRLMGIKENINVNHLITPSINNYLEVGYSVDNIFRFVRFDLTASFIDGKYDDFTFQIGITSDMFTVD